MAPTPLSTLLSQALVAFTIELDNEFEHRFQASGGGARVTSFVMWSNLLRFVGSGIAVGELVSAVGLPKPSVLSRIGGVERWRYVSVGSGKGRRDGYGSARGTKDDWIVRFTPAGDRAAAIWPALPGAIEARWRKRFGADEIDGLVRALRSVDGPNDRELPEYLPIVSSTNGFVLDLPPSEKARATGDRPLVGLLAHALMAYTLELEESAALSLPLSENVLRVLDEAGVHVRDLPALAGVSKEAVEVSLTSLTKTDCVVVEGAPASKRTVRLTAAGKKRLVDQRRLHVRVGKKWEADLRAPLEHVLNHPELAAGLRPYPDGWRASTPYAAQTEAVLADPPGTLPHYPMVLHRGGWPDGS